MVKELQPSPAGARFSDHGVATPRESEDSNPNRGGVPAVAVLPNNGAPPPPLCREGQWSVPPPVERDFKRPEAGVGVGDEGLGNGELVAGGNGLDCHQRATWWRQKLHQC